jgi:hypothetical protein
MRALSVSNIPWPRIDQASGGWAEGAPVIFESRQVATEMRGRNARQCRSRSSLVIQDDLRLRWAVSSCDPSWSDIGEIFPQQIVSDLRRHWASSRFGFPGNNQPIQVEQVTPPNQDQDHQPSSSDTTSQQEDIVGHWRPDSIQLISHSLKRNQIDKFSFFFNLESEREK